LTQLESRPADWINTGIAWANKLWHAYINKTLEVWARFGLAVNLESGCCQLTIISDSGRSFIPGRRGSMSVLITSAVVLQSSSSLSSYSHAPRSRLRYPWQWWQRLFQLEGERKKYENL
jgi:hypothetical protein